MIVMFLSYKSFLHDLMFPFLERANRIISYWVLFKMYLIQHKAPCYKDPITNWEMSRFG